MESKKKNGSDEPRGRTGIKTQTSLLRMDFRTRGGGRVSRDEVRDGCSHLSFALTYIHDKCKIDS